MDENPVQITTRSVEETFSLGEMVGRAVSSPVLILLTGDLGSGKTAFVQGLGKGLDVPEDAYITSPSYTLVNEYPGRIPIYHVDLYRLSGPEDFENTGIYDILADGIHVIAMEWANMMEESRSMEHLGVHFQITGNDTRTLEISSAGKADSIRKAVLQEMRTKKGL
jgi:tRNA threonylcarbamoyladenosine biosynthesis protein TsaE